MTDPYLELAQTIRLATEAFDGFDPSSLNDVEREDLLSLIRLLDGDEDRGLSGRVSLVLASVKSELASRMEFDVEQIGDFQVERRMSKQRTKWRHREVWDALSRFADEQGLDAAGALDVARTAAPSPSWTSGGLRKLGMSPDSFCEPGEVRTSLIVRRHVEEEVA